MFVPYLMTDVNYLSTHINLNEIQMSPVLTVQIISY